MTLSRRARTVVAVSVPVVVLAAAAFAVGASAGVGSSTGGAPTRVQALGDGFLGGITTPTPEATVNPEPGSWDGVTPPAGYEVVLITASEDAATTTLSDAVEEWAARENVELTHLTAANDDQVESQITAAVAAEPDVVIGAGDDVVDVFALLTAQNLAQDFLVVGAELPEPTENVVSVIWPGATFRGTGLGSSGDIDPASVTPEHAANAVTAGIASVLHDLTGIVIRLPA